MSLLKHQCLKVKHVSVSCFYSECKKNRKRVMAIAEAEEMQEW